MSPSDRRTVLATLGSVMAASLAGCPGGNSTGTTGQPTEESVTTSTTDRPTPNTATDGEPYAETTLQQARETGIAVRDSVVAMSLDPPSIAGTGWYFGSSDLVVTAGHVIAVRDTGWTAWQPDGTQVDLRYLGDAYIDGVDVGALRADGSGPPLSAGSADDLKTGRERRDERIDDQQDRIDELSRENEQLRERLAAVEARLSELEAVEISPPSAND